VKDEQERTSFQRHIVEDVRTKEARKLRARKEKHRTAWFGFRMLGLVGWAVSLPTIIGAAIGVWLDKRWPSPYSWTLTCLLLGILAGCIYAWVWVSREHEKIHRRDEE
jgi:ATP synthase protein I